MARLEPWAELCERLAATPRKLEKRSLMAGYLRDLPVDEGLLSRLREWRQQTAREAGLPAFVVFTDDTLRRIAARRPATAAGLAGIPGVGPAKRARYGSAVAGICASAGDGTRG
jgi:superfamily II DNA helicase RecQ